MIDSEASCGTPSPVNEGNEGRREEEGASGSCGIEETTPDLLKNTPSNIARLEDVIEHCIGRQKYLAQTRSPSDGSDVRWYFCKVPLPENVLAAGVPRSEVVGKSEYFRFGMRDSLAIEASFLQKQSNNTMASNSSNKNQSSINTKIILLSFLLLCLLLLIIRTSFPYNSKDFSQPETATHISSSSSCPTLLPTCTKIPPSLANVIVHYTTSNITPQQTLNEISVSLRVLQKKSPCNFLVFGLGHDSLMWNALNHGGRTVFLEEDSAWIEQITNKHPNLEAFHVSYDTKVHQADELLKIGTEEKCLVVTDPRFSKCELSHKGFPSEVYDTEWDVIMVDAPTGYHENAPGRMTAIYTAGLLARNKESGETDVFVHDVNRDVEDKFSMGLLCEGYFREQEGRLRHFTIPSHRARSGRPFCP